MSGRPSPSTSPSATPPPCARWRFQSALSSVTVLVNRMPVRDGASSANPGSPLAGTLSARQRYPASSCQTAGGAGPPPRQAAPPPSHTTPRLATSLVPFISYTPFSRSPVAGITVRPMHRSVLALLGVATLAACGDLSVGNGRGAMQISPVLDSMFVGDRLPALRVTYIAPDGHPALPGRIVWASSDTTIAQIDTVAGGITGRKRGAVVITAQAQGLTGGALLVVSDPLDITLLLDTVYMMPGDTLRVPVVVLKSNTPPAATVWFQAPSNSAYTIDSASGRMTALAPGGPLPYIVHADSLADTGAVYVMRLADTTGGKIFYSVRGTVITHVGGPARAANFLASSGR